MNRTCINNVGQKNSGMLLRIVACFLIFNNFKLLLKNFALSLGENYSLKTPVDIWENNAYTNTQKEDLRRRQEVFIIFECKNIIFCTRSCKRKNSSSSKGGLRWRMPAIFTQIYFWNIILFDVRCCT